VFLALIYLIAAWPIIEMLISFQTLREALL